MSFSSEYAALRKKRKKNEEEEASGTSAKTSKKSSFAEQYAELRSKRSSSVAEDDDIAPVRNYGTRLYSNGIKTFALDDIAPVTDDRETYAKTLAYRKFDEQQAMLKLAFKKKLEDEAEKDPANRIEQIREANKGKTQEQIKMESQFSAIAAENEAKKAEEEKKKAFGSTIENAKNKTAAQRELENVILKGDQRKAEQKEAQEAETEEKRTWFQAEAFEDGYDFGDVTKSVGATLGDIGVNAFQGLASMGEGIIDFGIYAEDLARGSRRPIFYNAQTGEKIDIDEDLREWAQKDVVGDFVAPAKEWLDGASFLGDKSDSVAQGLGQIAGIYLTGGLGEAAGLGSAGATALTTGMMFASSAGSGIGEAYASGASDEQAMAYGVLKGLADAGSELIFGGLGKGVNALGVSRGLSSLDDMFAKKLSDGISNQVVKNFVEFGVKSSAEGFEEVLAGLGTAVAQKLTYMSDDELSKLIDDQDLFEQFVVGTVTSALAQSGYIPGMKKGSLRESNKTGRDFITGYTQSEQSVIDRVFEDRLSEMEEAGEELSEKDKKKLLEEVQSDLERGYISTDVIDEVIGGDSYKAWHDADTKENEILEEYNRLADTPSEKLSLNEQKRRDELDSRIEELRKKTESSRLRAELDNKLSAQLKGSRLDTSYIERGRKREAFTADLSHYENEAAKKSIQNLIDIGYANNTNAVHDFADAVAKLAEASGKVFSFVNNEQIREMGKAVEGRIVNGFITSDGVAVNLDSPKAWEFIVGHEVSHAFEQAKSYSELHDALKAYAQSKGEWDGRLKELTELYEGQDADVEAELVADLVGEYLFGDTDFISSLAAKNPNVFQKIYAAIKHLLKTVTAGSKQARQLERAKYAFEKAMRESGKAKVEGTEYSLTSELDGAPIENDRILRDEYDTQYSLSRSNDIAKGQTDYLANQNRRFVSYAELKEAQKVTAAMVDVMMKYSDILPEDKIGKVLTKNGAYDRSVENTTICIRTLAYNEFVDKVQEEIGRPLTQMESFLVSQKLYDIATDPQCLYCYVSLDRKSFNEMLLRYMQDRDTVIAKYNSGDKTPASVDALYQDFLNGRKDTKNMKERFNKWISYADNGTQLLSLADIATNERQTAINDAGGILAEQLKDARRYAQSASWSKIQKDYVAYKDEILKLGNNVVKNLNEHYGLRWYSFSDYSAAFIVENMQQITDASIRGLKGLSYTKDTDYAEIFAPTGMNINISVFVKRDSNGNFYIDEKQSANFEKALALRDQYPNVGIVATVTDDDALRWAGEQEWSDVIIPFHIVRTGTDVAEYYKWLNYTSESGDTIKDRSLWDAYIDSLNVSENGRKNVSKNIYPSEHKNDKATYLNLCESRGLSPRFVRYSGEAWYMKLVNETRLSADDTPALKPIFNEEAAKASFQKFVDKGGYEGGWYRDGVDVDAEARAVADDILAGRKANEVDYGRQDNFDPEAIMSKRKQVRSHQNSLSYENEADANADKRLNNADDTVPVREDAARVQDTDRMPPVREDVQAEAETAAVPTPEAAEATPITTVGERLSAKKGNYETELEANKANRAQAWANYDAAIAEAQAEYDGLKNKNTKRANNLLRRIDRLKRQQANVDADYAKRIADLEASIVRRTEDITKIDKRMADLASDIASLTLPESQEDFVSGKVAQSLTTEPAKKRKKRGLISLVKEYVLDNGMVFEDKAKETQNRQLEAKWNSIRYARGMAQRFLKKGVNGARSIVDLETEVTKKGLEQSLYDYLHHMHNVDRMSIESKAQAKIDAIVKANPILAQLISQDASTNDILNNPLFRQNANILKDDVAEILRLKQASNLPVFGETVTADISRAEAKRLEEQHPELKKYAEEIYANNRYLRELLVKEGIITPETAALWEEMYPHYVPIRRDKTDELTQRYRGKKTGVNAPLKRAEGGNSDILPLFNSIALRAEQTYRAILKNRFGLELMNTLGTKKASENASLEDAINSVEFNNTLLQPGDDNHNPTFTVFENGKKVTFEITEEMYDAMRPAGAGFSYTSKTLNTISNLMRGLLTEYNPVFTVKNFLKDAQDVIMNSQHPAETYAAIPKAVEEMKNNGRYYNEYLDNGGEQNSYFDDELMVFDKPNIPLEVIKTITGLNAISKANRVTEMTPRLAEYIASREAGRSIEVSMLDAARVTTNFAAGGKLTKMLNRNGFTFLNASVQGFTQNVRNIREAKMNGLRGWVALAAKTLVLGAPAFLLNNLIWDDDEEYEELSDYVKQNYYIVGKFGDGKFVRIPKGRVAAVIQDAFTQMENVVTGDDELDMRSFVQLVIDNLAPNNPFNNNVAAPIFQVLNNTTWYNEDLVPTRLQDVPAGEQYDETTDMLSKWLGEKLDISPYKLNYLLDQYTGGIGDILLPMITPESETGNDSFIDYATAPFRDQFTTDSVLKNQNVSDFYDLKDELNVNANSSKATDDDTLKNKYMNAMGDRISELQKQKREIQARNDLSKSEKYDMTRDLQKEIVALTKEAIDSYENLNQVDGNHTEIGGYYYEWYTPEEGEPYWRKMTDSQKTKYLLTKDADGHYVTDGNVHYRLDEDGEWTKISDKDLARQNEVTKELGITPDEYWSKTETSFFPVKNGEYEYAYENPEKYTVAKAVGGYDSYKSYSKELSGIKADKDENGKPISGSRKEKVLDYINGLDIDYGEKIILFKNEYNADDTYNYDIINYLNSRDDISYSEMETILKELGFDVDSEGNVSW